MWRVTGVRDATYFDASGSQSVDDIHHALGSVGSSLTSHRRVLDFGCGCGRILRWLQPRVGVELHGCDIDVEAIAWVAEHLPHARCVVSDALPPLPHEADYFDLVYNHSVFTHLPETYQDAWLAELNRITRPGGLVLLTVSGDHPFAGFCQTWLDAGADPASYERRYHEHGLVYIEDDSWTGGPFPDFYHSTFHAPWYVFEHWTKFLDLKAYLVRGALGFQDMLVLQSRK